MSYLEKMFNLEGKVAAITGAGGMLCGEMAKGLARTGVKILVLDQRKEKADAVVKEIESNGGEAFPLAHQATEKESFEEALKVCLKQYGKCDVLINGAGINAPTPLLEISEQEWDEILAVHLKGTLFGCQVFGKMMLEKGGGSIVNMSSASAGPPLSKAFAYSVAKSGIHNLTQNVAREWASAGVRVNALRPGFFPTEWSQKHFIDEKRKEAIWGHTPAGRYGRPDELLGAVLWLCSDAASFVTGSEVTVDGGFSCMTI